MINESVLMTARRDFGCLNEMFIEGKRNLQHGSFILAFRSKIWVFPDQQSMEEASKRMINSVRKETGVKKFSGDTNAFEERPDVLMAQYSDANGRPELHIMRGANFNPRPESSVLVKKVAQALKVVRVSVASEYGNDDVTMRKDELAKEQTPTWGYHGTSTKYLMGILTHGLVPKPNQTNFDTVIHDKTVFLTTDPSKAVFHATTAAAASSRKRDRKYGETQTFEHQRVVLKVRVPDPALIVADYDIDREGEQSTYTDMHQTENSARVRGTIPGDPRKVSQSLGVFGYRGRILPQHIEYVEIDGKHDDDNGYEEISLSDMDRFSPEHIRKWWPQMEDMTGGELEHIDIADFMRHPEQYIDEDRASRGEDDDA